MKTIQHYSLTVKALACLLFATAATADPIYYDLPAGMMAPGRIIQFGDGNFYGTSAYASDVGGIQGNGEIFKMTPDGVFSTFYTFNGTDGSWPTTLVYGLPEGGGGFWGATLHGGPTGNGTIFTLTSAGVLTTLTDYSCSLMPFAASGTAYGFTDSSIFQIVSGGTVVTIANKADVAALRVGKTRLPEFGGLCLYGVTSNSVGFKMALDGTTSTNWGTIPAGPPSSELNVSTVDNCFYGTTSAGGAHNAGCVYKIDAETGVATIVASFNGGSTGGAPKSLMHGIDGNYYGTTTTGSSNGFGGIFRVTPTGDISQLYAFQTHNGSASLTQDGYEINNNIYGIISEGGAHNAGRIFRINPKVKAPAPTFSGGQGQYNGLFAPTDGSKSIVDIGTSGMLQLAVNSIGKYAGKLSIAGGMYIIRGAFDASGNTTTVATLPSSTLEVDMTLNATTGEITGNVIESTGKWTAALRAERALRTPGVANYTMLIPSADPTGATSPAGPGYGTIHNGNGMVAFLGAMADGTRAVMASPLSQGKELPVYMSWLNGQEQLQGWLNFSSGAPVGTLTWIKNANVDPIYTSGFTNRDIAVSGSVWVAPAPGTPVIPVTGGTLTVTGTPNGTLVYKVNGTTSPGNCLQVISSNAPVALQASVGRGTGKLMLKIGKVNPIKTTSAVLQNTTSSGGAFIQGTQAGSFTLTP